MSKQFGESMCIAGLTLTGPIERDHAMAIPNCIQIAKEIVAAIGMTCSHSPQIADYPAKDGKPSPGFIVTQPIIESAILLDVWPPLQCMYVHIVSCKPFDIKALRPVLDRWNLNVTDRFTGGLER